MPDAKYAETRRMAEVALRESAGVDLVADWQAAALSVCRTVLEASHLAETPDALSPADAEQLEKAITDFEDCGETDVPDAALQRFAAMGYLECAGYNVLPAARAAIDAARAQQEAG